MYAWKTAKWPWKGRCYVMPLFLSLSLSLSFFFFLFFFFFFCCCCCCCILFSFGLQYGGGWVGGSVVQFGLMFDTSLLVRHTVDLEAWGMFYSFFVFSSSFQIFVILVTEPMSHYTMYGCNVWNRKHGRYTRIYCTLIHRPLSTAHCVTLYFRCFNSKLLCITIVLV
ncbi:hypothetical protein B0T13DRAFT_112953 [Neurospora crassa]|nr:hypothetical protein B0T13DRAFT_112953 [Neurospora crassa]